PDIRALFTPEATLSADWYRRRLEAKQRSDERLWSRHLAYLEECRAGDGDAGDGDAGDGRSRRELALAELRRVGHPSYLEVLNRTLGLDPSLVAAEKVPPGG